MITSHSTRTIVSVVLMVLGATAGETLISAAMRRVGDPGTIRARSGLSDAIFAVATSPLLILGVACMTISFFSLLLALSGSDLSLIAPATNSLTFIATAFSAKFFLKENVDRRRWLAAVFVTAGVVLLSR